MLFNEINGCVEVFGIDESEIVNFSVTALHREFFYRFGRNFQANENMKSVLLCARGICDDLLLCIAKSLRKQGGINELNLGSNNITNVGLKFLAQYYLSNANTLTYLRLGWNDFGDEGLKYICDALTHHVSLNSLELHCNSISYIGVSHVVSLLQSNSSITRLTLYDNNLGDRGVVKIAGFLKGDQFLREIDLSSNDVENIGAETFAAAIQQNRGLMKFGCVQNKFDKRSAAKLDAAVIANSNILYAYYDYKSEAVESILTDRFNRVSNLLCVWGGGNIKVDAFNNTGLFACSRQMRYLSKRYGVLPYEKEVECDKQLHTLLCKYFSVLGAAVSTPIEIREMIVGYLSDDDKETLWTVIRGTQAIRELVATADNTISI